MLNKTKTKTQDADTNTDRLIKGRGDATQDLDKIKTEEIVDYDSQLETILTKRKISAYDSIMFVLNLVNNNTTKDLQFF